MWEAYELKDFGWTKAQWKGWKRLWTENGSLSPKCKTDEEWEVIERRIKERRMEYEDRVERALKLTKHGHTDDDDGHVVKGYTIPSQSERMHDEFYAILAISGDVLTPEQEEESQRFNAWLQTVEDVSEVTGV